MQRAVAQQAGHGGAVEPGPVDHPPAPACFEVVQLDDHVHMGTVAPAGTAPLMVEEEAADVDHGVGPAGHRRARFGIEGAVEHPAVVEGLGQVQRAIGLRRLAGSGRARTSQTLMARLTPATVSGMR